MDVSGEDADLPRDEIEATGDQQGQDAAPDQAEDHAQDEDEAEEVARPVHMSTGRLTGPQADAVDRWRARLRTSKPLPGAKRKDAELAWIGIDNRPVASSSDVIAAAVKDLLENAPPEPLEVARYAERSRAAARAAGQGQTGDHLPRFSPVSFYLAGGLLEASEQLRAAAYDAVLDARRQAAEEAEARFPREDQTAERRACFLAEMRDRKIPFQMHQVPRGLIARMAIDRWRRRAVDKVIAAAVTYAADHHDKPQRARQDMYGLRP